MGTSSPRLLETIDAALEENGLSIVGAFHTHTDTVAPRDVLTIALIGHVGSTIWPTFATSPELADGAPHPLDRWSHRIALDLGRRFNADVLMPSDGPPYWPFQQWALAGTNTSSSPLGLLVHTTFGLWVAYRAALTWTERVPLGAFARDHVADANGQTECGSPCNACAQPCLNACPVDAFSTDGYNVDACRQHVASDAGRACRETGCLARRACPVAPDKAYRHEHARFHMDAFVR